MLLIGQDAEGVCRFVDVFYGNRSMVVSSNLHSSGLDELMPNDLATATVDRLLRHSHIYLTEGESLVGAMQPAVSVAGADVALSDQL